MAAKICLFAALLVGLLGTTARADFTISKRPTHDVSCVSGVCTATTKSANLNVGELTDMLASGDATVKTGGGANTIQVQDGFSWSSSRLTLDANKSVGVHQPVAVAGKGGLTITYNDGGAGGDLLFFDGAKIDFADLDSSLIVNGENYALLADIDTLAQDILQQPDGRLALASDYDASADGVRGTSPVHRFEGTFEGLGHTIDRFSLKTNDRDAALFSILKKTAVVRDLALTNVKLTGKVHTIAAVGGYNQGLVAHCFASGTVTGRIGAGLVGANAGAILDGHTSVSISVYDAGAGLVLTNTGTIDGSSADGDVQAGYGNSGGLVALNEGTITNSSASGRISGTTHGAALGGLVGYNFDGAAIRLSHASGDISVGEESEGGGGLVGNGSGEIVQSFATGNVSGNSASLGGLAGVGGKMIQSYATGTVSGKGGEFSGAYSGGLAGYADAEVDEVYSTGHVAGGWYVGGLVGLRQKTAHFTSSYWDLDTSGRKKPCGYGACKDVTRLTDAQLKAGLPKGFDPKIWGSDPNINGGYPYLLANPPPK